MIYYVYHHHYLYTWTEYPAWSPDGYRIRNVRKLYVDPSAVHQQIVTFFHVADRRRASTTSAECRLATVVYLCNVSVLLDYSSTRLTTTRRGKNRTIKKVDDNRTILNTVSDGPPSRRYLHYYRDVVVYYYSQALRAHYEIKFVVNFVMCARVREKIL